MNADGRPAAPSRHAGTVALVATLAIQMFTAVVTSAPAVLAPVLAPDLGITPKWIGVFVAFTFAGAMVGSLGCGEFIVRHGAIRVSQVAVGLCVAGIGSMALLPAAGAPLLVVAGFVAGLGYGPITAASSEVLARTTPADRMALTFSIKQTGVPAGAALAGALLPALALATGWRVAFLAVALAGVAVAIAAEPTRKSLDLRSSARQAFSLATLLRPLRVVVGTPRLRELSLVGLAFAAVQTSLSTFLVVYLTDGLGWSLVAAGLALTCATSCAVAGRILWGMAADRWWAPNRILAAIGVLASVCGAVLALAGPGWPAWFVLPLVGAYGATAIGWNGVQLSELARRAPPGMAAAVTGASGFLTFAGVVFGPLLYAGLAALTGGYRAGFAASAVISGLAAAALIRHGSRG
ncbi:MAG: MFS transporter [Burkholderiales bacterium]